MGALEKSVVGLWLVSDSDPLFSFWLMRERLPLRRSISRGSELPGSRELRCRELPATTVMDLLRVDSSTRLDESFNNTLKI